MPEKPHVAFVSFQEFDPRLRNGAALTLLGRLRMFRSFGAEASIVNFLADDPRNQRVLDQAMASGEYTDVVQDGRAVRGVLRGVNVYYEILRHSWEQLRVDYQPAIKAILRGIQQANPDFIFTADQGYLPLLAAWLSELPGAHSFHHGDNVEAFAGHPFYVKLLQGRTVFAVSEYLRTFVRTKLGVDSEVWHSMIHLEDYVCRTPKADLHGEEGAFIGYRAGGWAKGDPLVSRIAQQLPEHSFVVAGRGLCPELATAAPNVRLLGHLFDMRRFYGQIAVLLAPSLNEDPFPRVVLEACANGIPVIANRVGGIPEALAGSGILIDVDLKQRVDLDMLADRYIAEIRRITGDAELYDQLRQKALVRAENFRLDQERRARAVFDKLF